MIAEVFGCSVNYLFARGDNDGVIREYTRAANMLELFNEDGWLSYDLSCFYETVALAYANKREYDACLEYLEKAANAAVLYEKRNSNLTDGLYGLLCDIPNDTMDRHEKVSACKSMLDALGSVERGAYDPIRNSDRFRRIKDELTEAVGL